MKKVKWLEENFELMILALSAFFSLPCNKPVHTIKDLSDQKIRVMTNQYHIAYWNALGAAATPMQFTEVFMGLQQET